MCVCPGPSKRRSRAQQGIELPLYILLVLLAIVNRRLQLRLELRNLRRQTLVARDQLGARPVLQRRNGSETLSSTLNTLNTHKDERFQRLVVVAELLGLNNELLGESLLAYRHNAFGLLLQRYLRWFRLLSLHNLLRPALSASTSPAEA